MKLSSMRRYGGALALALLATSACESAAQRRGAQASGTLTLQVEEAARGPDRRLDLRGSRLGFDWDRLVMLPAYATTELARRQLGFPWREVLKSTSQVQDRYQLLVFVRGDQVVAWMDYDVGRGDFGVLLDRPLPNAQAVFAVQTDGEGRHRLLLSAPPP